MSGLRTSGASRHTIPSMVLADGCFRDSETAAQSPPWQRPTEDHGGAGGNAMAAMHGMMRGQGAGVANRAREKGWCDAGLQRQPAHELAAPVRSRLLHAARLKAAKSLGRARIALFSTVSRRAGNIAPRLLASALLRARACSGGARSWKLEAIFAHFTKPGSSYQKMPA